MPQKEKPDWSKIAVIIVSIGTVIVQGLGLFVNDARLREDVRLAILDIKILTAFKDEYKSRIDNHIKEFERTQGIK